MYKVVLSCVLHVLIYVSSACGLYCLLFVHVISRYTNLIHTCYTDIQLIMDLPLLQCSRNNIHSIEHFGMRLAYPLRPAGFTVLAAKCKVSTYAESPGLKKTVDATVHLKHVTPIVPRVIYTCI